MVAVGRWMDGTHGAVIVHTRSKLQEEAAEGWIDYCLFSIHVPRNGADARARHLVVDCTRRYTQLWWVGSGGETPLTYVCTRVVCVGV